MLFDVKWTDEPKKDKQWKYRYKMNLEIINDKAYTEKEYKWLKREEKRK